MPTIQASFQFPVGVADTRTRPVHPAPATGQPARRFAAIRALLAKWRWEAERPDRWVPYY